MEERKTGKTNDVVVAVRDLDHGPGEPYEPSMHRHHLHRVGKRSFGKRYYVTIDGTSKTWISDKEAKAFIAAAGRPSARESNPRIEKKSDIVVPVMVGTAVVVSAGILLWNELTAKAPADEAPPGPGPQLRPDGTWGADPSSNPLAGPIYPAHGRILVVGGQLAANLAYGLQVALTGTEKAVPGIPATPEQVSVWSGIGTTTYEGYANSVAGGVPADATDLAGKGPPDVIVVLVGDYDAAAGPQGDIGGSAKALAKALAPVARDHRPNIVWVLPWAGKYALEQALVLGPALVLASEGRVYPFLPDAKTIPMELDGRTPTPAGYRILSEQVAGILLDWWTKVGNG